MDYPKIRLLKKEDRRLRQGHLWIYSNEIDSKISPVSKFSPGELVLVEDARGQAVGLAYVHPHTLIAARLLELASKQGELKSIDRQFFVQKLSQALQLRNQFFQNKPFYRLVYGEGDGLPGLVIDRFGDFFVLQSSTAGMDKLLPLVVEALIELFAPRVILERSEGATRELEGLEARKGVVYGDFKENQWARLEENQTSFETPLLLGQKTGWFYDHRMARAQLACFVQGKTVLDVFSYLGAWGIQACRHGASSVLCTDSSELALEGVRRNAELNHFSSKVSTEKGDAFDVLGALNRERRSFDVILLDPPAFIKRKKDYENGLQAYLRCNSLALKLLKPGGVLVSSSCSFHLKKDTLLSTVQRAGLASGLSAKLVMENQQGPDHPIPALMPELAYLKSLFFSMPLSF